MKMAFIAAPISLRSGEVKTRQGNPATMNAGHSNRIAIRIYYEDTDFSGRVYHASYLRFFERGRTEWLRSIGLEHSELARSDGIAFAITSLQVEFHAAAIIDDCLEVVTRLKEHKGARLVFQQLVRRGDLIVTKAIVEVVCLRGDRAVRPPRALLQALALITRR
jgi:acyl-CoA thioester hydrolase